MGIHTQAVRREALATAPAPEDAQDGPLYVPQPRGAARDAGAVRLRTTTALAAGAVIALLLVGRGDAIATAGRSGWHLACVAIVAGLGG